MRFRFCTRRGRAIVIAVLVVAASTAKAQSGTVAVYPVKPVRVIVGFPAGGGIDSVARIFSQHLAESFKQPFIVDNRAGASGNIGAAFVAKAPADGHTLLVTADVHVITPAFSRDLGFDPVKDFAAVATVTAGPQCIAVHPSVPARSLVQLVALAKSGRQELAYASAGSGTLTHIGMELFRSMAGIKLLHVPYKGSGPSTTAAVGGEVPLIFIAVGLAQPHAKAGRLRMLADETRRMLDESRFHALKLKGSYDVESDVTIMQTLRHAHPGVKLRIDPSGVWTTHQAIWAGMRMEPLDLEYVEDACTGLESMAAVRQKIRIPLCTNMCVVRPEDFAPAMRLGAVDVIHGDAHRWGGISVTKRLGALCDAFGLGMNLHTAGELGISTACHLQLAAAMPEVRYAIDSLYDLLADDITKEPIRFADGFFSVPHGPGLGVELDPDKLERYTALNASEGDYNL